MNCNDSVPATCDRYLRRVLTVAGAALLSGASLLALAGPASAQTACPVEKIPSGLQSPQSIVQSDQGNLLVAESGGRPPNAGRISIVGLAGDRRTLVSGLPSGIDDVGGPSGPAGLALRGRTLFALIGVGDAILNGPLPGTFIANPHPSSPILSSVLAIHLGAHVEQTTEGFTLSLEDQQTLAAGQRVTLSNGGGDRLTIELVADFPDYTTEPLASVPQNVRGSNPFALVAVGDQLYVTDGAQNQLRQVDIPTGAISTVATFPTVPNPLPIGPPLIEAVPTGIAYTGGQLLVTLFSGVPFAPGTSSVAQVDPASGSDLSFITGLTDAIGILPLKERASGDYLVLQTSSGPGPFFSGPGHLLRFDAPGGAPSIVADCLELPTSMVLDKKTGTLYVTELTGGIVSIVVGR
jgi:hypothetical protein